jgi:hypothetical protein
MKYAAILGFGLMTLVATLMVPGEAKAVVCARGVRGGGCVGAPRGAVVVRPAPHAVVVLSRGLIVR